MKLNRIISLELAILLLFLTVSCDQAPTATPATSDDITTTPKVTTTQKTTTTTTQQNQIDGFPIGWGSVRGDYFHCTAAERISQTGWMNLNHLLAIDNDQKALFDGDPSTVYANWDKLLNAYAEPVAFSKDVQLWAVEITFENTTYYYYSSFLAGYISVRLGNDYSTDKATVAYWGKEEVDGKLMIQLPEKLYWEVDELYGTRILKSGEVIMDVSGLNLSNPIVDIQFYGIVVESEA
jgi:hypothetical protein